MTHLAEIQRRLDLNEVERAKLLMPKGKLKAIHEALSYLTSMPTKKHKNKSR